MKFLILLALCIIIQMVAAQYKNSVTSLGSADGKTFYLLSFMNGVSWFEAAEECCESGGRLGTIQSPAQYNVLKSQQLATRAICKEYWVAGRLVASYEPYEWKYDNRTVVTYYGRPIRRSERTDRDYCLKGLATYTEPELETDRCAYEYTRCALCQK